MASSERSHDAGVRWNVRNLAPLQTSFSDSRTTGSRWRRTRPDEPAVERKPGSSPPGPAVARLQKLENRQSRMSLFSLFSRPKVEKARGHHEAGLPAVQEPRRSRKPPPVSASPLLKPEGSTPALRSPLTAPRPAPFPKSKAPKGSLSKRTRQFANWDPPPLFQAYPQSVKYAAAQATSTSAEALIRSQNHRRQYSLLQEKIESRLDLHLSRQELGEEAANGRASTSSAATPELVRKIYVLVTSGFVLQYASEGEHDRLPEKVLQLTKDSAAFASDLIPGKHWVLQVSHSASPDGSAPPQSKSLLSRLRLQSSGPKWVATSLLLVLESAEELDSWLTSVRKEIDALNGVNRTVDEPEPGPVLHSKPSHRYLVRRDPNRFDVERTPVSSPTETPMSSAIWDRPSAHTPVTASDSGSVNSSQHALARASPETPSAAASAAPAEVMNFSRLRDNSNRYSVVSSRTSGSGTIAMSTTSAGTSPPPSPMTDSIPKPDAEPPRQPISLRSFHMNPSTSASKRRSVQTLPTTREQTPPPPPPPPPAERSPRKLRRRSTLNAAGPPAAPQDAPRTAPSSGPDAENRPSSCRPSVSRSASAPTLNRFDAFPLSPPPALPADPPPAEANDPNKRLSRPVSTLGSLPNSATLSQHSIGRPAPSQKIPFRPVPIRTSEPPPPRRYSSLPSQPLQKDALPSLSSRFSQHSLPPQAQSHPAQALRRPSSVQIRSDPAPFLSSSRPAGAYTNRSRSSSGTLPVIAIPAALPHRPRIQARRSMPAMGLPPPAPPPNVPLPPPPPTQLMA